MPVFLGIFPFLLTQHDRPAENQDKSRAAKHPDGPVELTGLNQCAAVGNGHNAVIDAVIWCVAPGDIRFNDRPVAVCIQGLP